MPDSPADFAAEIPLTPEALEAAQDALAAALAAAQVPEAARYKVRLVIEELVANLMMHAVFPGTRGPARLAARLAPGFVLLDLDDSAVPFDPRTAPEPAGKPGEAIGGLGLKLVRQMAEIRGYLRLPEGWNRTELAVPRGG